VTVPSKFWEAKRQIESEPLKCRFHDLRHTAVTRLLEAGIPYPVVASIMGWLAATAIRLSKHYGHIGNQALRAAVEVLGGMGIPVVSLKKFPNSSEAENGIIK
jgi:integrase